MADLILHWLNAEIILGKKIENIETDFSSGYRFGELITKLVPEKDHKIYSKKNSKEAKDYNFELLTEELEDLNLTVDESTFEKIKEKKRGAALKMLYQIKLKTEKSLFTSPKKQSIKESQIFSKKSSIGHISNEASLKFDAKMHTTQMLKSKLRPFEDEKRTQEQTIKQKHLEMTNLHHSVAMTKRAAEMDKQMNNKQFMKEWHHKGMKDWRKNQDDKLLRLEKARLLKERFDDIKNTKTQKIRNDATEEMQGGIEGFQRNLEKLGIDINVIPDENKDKKKKPKSFAETFSSVATMNKIRERKVAGDFARKEKERRTNKLMVDQARSQNEIMWRMEETKRLEELRQLGNTKREKAYEKWRIKQCKKIEQQKRTRKNDKFESRRGKELEIELEKNKKDFEEVSIELKQEYSENRKLCYEQEQRKRKEKREEHTEDMEEVLLDILEIANKAMKAQKESTTHQIPPHLFKSWINMLKRGEPLTFKSARSMALTKTQTRLTTMKDTIVDEGDQLDKLQLTDYLLHLAFYKPQFILNAAQYAVSLISNFNQIDAFSLSVRGGNFPQIEDNCDIGDVLKRIVYAIYKVPDTKLGGELGVCVPNFAHLPLKFAMIGRDGAGKSVLAQFLSEKYGVKVFRVEKMVKDVLELVRPKEEVEEEVKKGKIPVKKQPKKLAKGEVEEKKLDLLDSEEIRSVGEEIASCVSDGDEILDILYVRLFIANLNATFSPKDRTAKKAEMKTAILREKEINEEIEKLQDDLNNKAKQKVAAKRQTDLQAELETLKKPLEPGWLLVDFPKTLKQAQLLEECLSGYSTDLSAAEIARNNKVASNELIIPSSSQKENTDLQKSGLDCVVCINTSKPVCKSRQLEKNEELLRKSQEIEKEKEKINTISEEDLLEKHIEWDKNAEALMRWFNKFGFAEQNFPLCQFVENNESAEETQNKLSEIAEGILAMHKKEDEETLNEIMKELEGGDNEPTETETEKATEEEGEKKIKDSIEGREEEGEEHKTEECGQEKPSEHEELLNQWNDFQEDYIAALKDLFKGDRRQKDLIVNGLIDIQKQFYSFLERNADEKQMVIDALIDRINKMDFFLDKFQISCNQIDDVNDELWNIIEKRKDEAIQQRIKIINSKWIKHEILEGIGFYQSLMQQEMKKFLVVVNIVVNYSFKQHNMKTIPPLKEYIAQNSDLYDNEQPMQMINLIYEDAYYYVQAFKIDINLPQNSLEEETNLKKVIEKEKENLILKIELLKYWGLTKVFGIIQLSESVFEKLDDWIVAAVREENIAANEIINMLKEKLNEEERIPNHTIKGLTLIVDPTELNSQLLFPQTTEASLSIQFSDKQILSLFSLLKRKTFNDYIDIDSLVKIFLKIIKENKTDEQNGLPPSFCQFSTKTFYEMNIFEKESKLLNWKQLLVYFILLENKLPTNAQIETYQNLLKQEINDYDEIPSHKFLEIKPWFDEETNLLPLICEIIKTHEGLINVSNYVKILQANELYDDFDVASHPERYYNLLFDY